jgi:hypothetical protein
MPQVSKDEVNAQYWEPVATGPAAQCDISANAQLGTIPTSLASSGSWTSPVISADGFSKIAAGVQLSVTGGSIVIQRYVDKAGVVPVPGSAPSATSLTTTPGSYATPNDFAPFQSFTVKITAPASAVTLSNFVLLLSM